MSRYPIRIVEFFAARSFLPVEGRTVKSRQPCLRLQYLSSISRRVFALGTAED